MTLKNSTQETSTKKVKLCQKITLLMITFEITSTMKEVLRNARHIQKTNSSMVLSDEDVFVKKYEDILKGKLEKAKKKNEERSETKERHFR